MTAKMDQAELDHRIALHKKWLLDEEGDGPPPVNEGSIESDAPPIVMDVGDADDFGDDGVGRS